MFKRFVLIISFVLPLTLMAQTTLDLPFLPLNVTGAKNFITQNPTYDGRGAVVIVLDSGVDMGVKGLLKNSLGEVKVIDVMDFSGEGDFFYHALPFDTTANGKKILKIDGYSLYGYDKLGSYPVDSIFYGGVIRESHFEGSDIEDLNGDGDTEDSFAYIVFNAGDDKEERFVAYIDLNGDYHIDDEEELEDYFLNKKFFYFRNVYVGEKRAKAAFALKILPDDMKIVLHYDGNAHGTHVAGIASGYEINGQEQFNGVAPGAVVMSCKIGDNRKSGGASTTGAMEAAIEYGIKRARELGLRPVFNMSYGIGSEWENHASMEKYLNELLAKEKDVVFCTSNGNSGPGISSSGLPSSASSVISSGALMEKENAVSIYGAHLKKDRIFYFSSRGGTVMKPDIITPGAASSTVPDFSYGENFWGTSMASPQTAGLAALLVSAAKQNDLPVINTLVKRALINSGKFIPDYILPDQGGGIPRIGKAFAIYKKLIERYKKNKPVNFAVSVASPQLPDGKASAFLYNSGSDLPEDIITFTVTPEFVKTPDLTKGAVFEAYKIYSTAPWLKPIKRKTYFKNLKPMHIPVRVEKTELNKQGIYSGKIYAVPVGSAGSVENAIFEGWVTIVKPYKMNSDNNYSLNFKQNNVEAGELKRYFVTVSPEIRQLIVKLRKNGNYAKDRFYIFNPEGRKIYTSRIVSKDNSESEFALGRPFLKDGVYEIDVYTMYSAEKKSSVSLKIDAFTVGLVNSETEITYKEKGNPSGEFIIKNHGDSAEEPTISGQLEGIYIEKKVEVSGTDFSSFVLHTPLNCEKVRVHYELPLGDYLKMTDVAIQVVDGAGKVILNTGLNYRTLSFAFNVKEGETYYLETTGAFADKSELQKSWMYDLKLYYFYPQPVAIDVHDKVTWFDTMKFFPYNERKFAFDLQALPAILPEKYSYFGQLIYSVDRLNARVNETIYFSMGK